MLKVKCFSFESISWWKDSPAHHPKAARTTLRPAPPRPLYGALMQVPQRSPPASWLLREGCWVFYWRAYLSFSLSLSLSLSLNISWILLKCCRFTLTRCFSQNDFNVEKQSYNFILTSFLWVSVHLSQNHSALEVLYITYCKTAE